MDNTAVHTFWRAHLIRKMPWECLPPCCGVKMGTRRVQCHQLANLNKFLPWALSCHPTDKKQLIKSTFHLDLCQNWLGQKQPFWLSWTVIALGDERMVIVKLNSSSSLLYGQPSSVFMTMALKEEEFWSCWTRKKWTSKKGSCVESSCTIQCPLAWVPGKQTKVITHLWTQATGVEMVWPTCRSNSFGKGQFWMAPELTMETMDTVANFLAGLSSDHYLPNNDRETCY